MMFDMRKLPVSVKLIEYIQSRLPEGSEVELCWDMQKPFEKMTLNQLMWFCEGTGIEFQGQSGKWVMPWMVVRG